MTKKIQGTKTLSYAYLDSSRTHCRIAKDAIYDVSKIGEDMADRIVELDGAVIVGQLSETLSNIDSDDLDSDDSGGLEDDDSIILGDDEGDSEEEDSASDLDGENSDKAENDSTEEKNIPQESPKKDQSKKRRRK